jgi:hypothetical protein
MGFWDAQTHMTKREWAAACRRTENRLKELQSELLGPVASASKGEKVGKGPGPRTPRGRAYRYRSR